MRPANKDIIFAYNRIWHQMYADELIETPEYQVTITKSQPDSFYNALHGLDAVSLQQQGEAEAIFARHHVRSGIYLEDSVAPPDGYRQAEGDSETWWLFDLKNLPAETDLTEGYIINEVDPDALDGFLAIDAAANDLPPVLVDGLKQRILTRRNYTNRFFLGSFGGVPAACGSVGFVGDIACLAEGGVLPEFRGRGFHKALTLRRLYEAASSGARWAVMVSAAGSRSNTTAQSVGFERLLIRHLYQKV